MVCILIFSLANFAQRIAIYFVSCGRARSLLLLGINPTNVCLTGVAFFISWREMRVIKHKIYIKSNQYKVQWRNFFPKASGNMLEAFLLLIQ